VSQIDRQNGASALARRSPHSFTESPQAARVPAEGALLLVVDDDPDVRELTGELLVELGYRCVLCADAAGALASFAEQPWAFAALLADFAMPGMNGIQLIEAVHRCQPTLPALLVTGYADHRAAIAFGPANILHKPFTIAALDERIRGLLATPRPRPPRSPC
jgi:CheY-like chemotaxis protein